MLKKLKVSLFLAHRGIRRGGIGTTLLTVLILSLIFINLNFLPAIATGVVYSTENQMIDYRFGHLIIEPAEGENLLTSVKNIERKISSVPYVEGFSSRTNLGVTFISEENFVSGVLTGINPIEESEITLFDEGLIEGEYLSPKDTDQILVGVDISGEEIARDDFSGLGGLHVGEKIDVTFANGVMKEYKIKGIFKVGKTAGDSYAFITEKEMNSITGELDTASNIIVRLQERGFEDKAIIDLVNLGIHGDITSWKVRSYGIVQEIVASFGLINMISLVIGIFMAITVIFIVIYINTLNRKKQIGILKAIGIGQNTIIASYIMKALFYCFIGIIFGIVFLYMILNYFSKNPIHFPMGEVVPLMTSESVGKSIFVLLISSLVAGFIPSWLVSKKDILEAIWG